MASEKNIGSVQATLEFDVQGAIKSIEKMDTNLAKHKQRMARYATDSIKHMNTLNDSIKNSSASIISSLGRVSSSMEKTFDRSLGKNISTLLDALNAQTILLGSSMNKVAMGVENLNLKLRGTKNAIGTTQTATIKWFDSANSLFNSFSKLSFKIFIIEQGVRQIYGLFNGMVGPGFQFASSMETLRIGMAGILASTTKMGEEQTTYAQGLEISEKILKRMQVEALRTTMTVQELSEAYQSTLAGGLNAGMDLEQIMDLTVAAANAVKSFGLPKQQVIQELRGLISGEAIRPGVDMLGTVLGYTTATVNQLRKEGKLYEDIMKRMEGFKMATYDLDTTWAGMMNNMVDGFNKLAGSAVEGLFGNMKRRVKEIRKAFYELKQEEHTFTNQKGEKETRTVTTDIIINKDTQKRLTMLYDTIDNFIELVYTLGKNSLPFLMAAFDAIVPTINAFLVLAKEVANYLSVIPGVISTVIDWLLQIPSAVLNGIGTVIDTFWMFTMNIIAAKHELKKMAGAISEAISDYGAFALVLTTTGGLIMGVVSGLASFKKEVMKVAVAQSTLNALMRAWDYIMAKDSLSKLLTFLIRFTNTTKMAAIVQAAYNAVVAASNYVFKIFTGQITLATAVQTAYTTITKGASVAVGLLSKGFLGALKSLELFLAKITTLSLVTAVIIGKFVAMASIVGGLVYILYKVTDATSVWGKSFQNLKDTAGNILEGLKLKVQAVFASKEESAELTRRAEQAFKQASDAWDNATSTFTMENVKKEILEDVNTIKEKLTNAISFKDILDPKIDNSKLPDVKSLFPAGAGEKEKEAIKALVKKYEEGEKHTNKIHRLQEQLDRLNISMHAGEIKRMDEKERKVKTYTQAIEDLRNRNKDELSLASTIADVKARDELISRIKEQYKLEAQVLEAKRAQAQFKFDFSVNQEQSKDIVDRVFGEYGELQVKINKNKELLTNFLAEIDSLIASGVTGKDLVGENGLSQKAKDFMQEMLDASPEQLAEMFNVKKEQFAAFVEFIKTKMAEATNAQNKNLETQKTWKDISKQYMEEFALGMGNAVYAWISGAQDIGQAMRDMVQELLRNALKLLVQWYTIFGIVSALSGSTKTGAIAANKMVLGIDGNNKFLSEGKWDGKWAEGGLIEGTGSTTGDSITAAVSPGEYVIRASAVRKLGVGYLDALNNISAKRPSGILPPISRVGRKFAEGGYVDDGGYVPKTVTTNEGNNGGGNVIFNMTFQSLNPEAGAEMMKEQLPFIKNAVVNWMRNDTSVRTATRGAAR